MLKDGGTALAIEKEPAGIRDVVLGGRIGLPDLVAVARHHAKVSFSEIYCSRVSRSRALVEKWIREGRVMYGVTTGFGALCDKIITPEETARLQRNIILSHATSVGEPLSIEDTRAMVFVMLQNMGQGYSGVRMDLLNHLKELLNKGVTPYAPREGSVGYLSVEAHVGLAVIGLGKVYYQGELMDTHRAYQLAEMKPLVLAAKEGLALISGTTSPTALAALAIYDMRNAARSADIIGAISLEVSKGTIKAFDERLMQARPYAEQNQTASNIRRILEDSEMAAHYENHRLQDALSHRAMPQLHGAAKRTLDDALRTVEEEMNTTSDNPIIWPEKDDGLMLSGCHCDASYVGLEMDSASIAATMIAKMSERRNFRLISGNLSELPWFLIRNPGLNSGMMIPQYTQAGLLNDMKMLSHPASVDSIPTCGGQEDYVSMGYNAAKKARQVAEKLEYILAIELMSVYQAFQFADPELKPGKATQAVLAEIGTGMPVILEDIHLHPHIEKLKEMIHGNRLVELVEAQTGALE